MFFCFAGPVRLAMDLIMDIIMLAITLASIILLNGDSTGSCHSVLLKYGLGDSNENLRDCNLVKMAFALQIVNL